MLPGEVSKATKIRMLERNEEFFVSPIHKITIGDIKSYRSEFTVKANRRFRKGNRIV